MVELEKKAINSFFWDFSNKYLTLGISFGISIILARQLSPEVFGVMAILLAIVGVSELLTGAGLIGALIQKEKISENHYSSVLIFNLAISLFIVFIFFI